MHVDVDAGVDPRCLFVGLTAAPDFGQYRIKQLSRAVSYNRFYSVSSLR